MTPDIHCSRASLEQLLAEALPEQLEHELSDHLSACPDCRGELEALAAGAEWWTEASQRLSTRRPLSDDETDHDADAAHFATDFAVDFLEASEDAENLGRLGEYEIVGIIGRGGMGIVLKGFQKELHRHVALKVLSPHLATSGAARRRFAREAQATAAVVHPHVMAIHSVNATAKLPYLVMPFVACQSLQERLDRNGPLDVIDILRIGLQAALGLAAAHAQGLVHRDVKPANILLETNVDRVLLTDFGLARAVDDATLTRTGIIAGTPQYMSPEQANGDAVDHRSDLFSLGAVLYAMCTGRPPFRAETTFGVLRRIRETSPREIREINAEIPDWLCRVVMKLLEKKQSERMSTAQEVAALLEQCLAHMQQPTAVPLPAVTYPWLVSREPSVRPQTSKRKWYFAFVAASMSITVGVWWLMQRPDVPARPVLETVFPERQPTPTAESAVQPLTEWNALQNELAPAVELLEQLEQSVSDDLKLVEPETTSPPPSRAKEEL